MWGRGNNLRSLLVVAELAVSVVLLIGAGLLIRSFVRLGNVPPGFNPHRVLSMVVSVAGSAEAESTRRGLFYRELVVLHRTGRLDFIQPASAGLRRGR